MCYSISIAGSLALYYLGWSTLYPSLSIQLLLFLSFTIVVNVLLGLKSKATPSSTRHQPQTTNSALKITIILYLLWGLEFLYEGGIPIIKILTHQNYNYRLFGIPTLHVLLVTFSSFYTIYIFQNALITKSKFQFLLFALNLFAAILIYSRAMFFLNIVGCFFIYANDSKEKLWRLILIILFLSVPSLLLFGALGTARVSNEAHTKYDNNHFLDVGSATESFRKSIIPKELFWGYIYATSPLANLQENVTKNDDVNFSVRKIFPHFVNECLPDFISKRINKVMGWGKPFDLRIPGPFNISTVYSQSFSYQGWVGLFIMAVFIILLPLFYFKLLPQNSAYYSSGWAILCTMFLFMGYDNPVKFSGISCQLFWPVLFHYVGIKSFGTKWLNFFRK